MQLCIMHTNALYVSCVAAMLSKVQCKDWVI